MPEEDINLIRYGHRVEKTRVKRKEAVVIVSLANYRLDYRG